MKLLTGTVCMCASLGEVKREMRGCVSKWWKTPPLTVGRGGEEEEDGKR